MENTVCVIGLGYMGLPMSSIIALAGLKVIGVDINQEKVETINKGECPFNEIGVRELINSAITEFGFKAQTTIPKSDVYIISVPTPHKNKKCDLSYVEKACEDLAQVIDNDALVIIESTIRPRTCVEVIAPIFDRAGRKVDVVHCPERAIPGNTIYELINNDRIIGGLTERATKRAEKLYRKFIKGKIHLTNATTAECIKLMENTFRDVNIALANEFSEILDEYGVNPFEAISLANRHPRVNILYPGPGVGGHCIAIDPWFLCEKSQSAKLIKLAREINENRPAVIVGKTSKMIQNFGNKVALLGVAYKKNVDDARETPARGIMDGLMKLGCEVRCTDPFVSEKEFRNPLFNLQDTLQWCDFFVLVTDHDCYRNLKTDKPFFDTRNIL